jgi:hypothetical protein
MYNIPGIYFLSGPTVVLAFTTTSAQSPVVSANAALLVATSGCYLAFGANPVASASGFYLPANFPLAISFDPTAKIAAMQQTAAGSLYITPIS